MGNSSSSHQPLERGFQRGTYGDIKNVVGIHIIYIYDFLFTSLLFITQKRLLRAKLKLYSISTDNDYVLKFIM